MKKFVQKISEILKETVIPLCGFLILASLVLTLTVPANAQTNAQSPGGVLNQLENNIGLPTYNTNANANASIESGASNITSAVWYAIDFAKYVMGTIAIFMIIVSGIRLITSGRQVDQIADKQKENLKYAIIGLLVIIIADQVVKVFWGAQGEIYRSQAELLDAAKQGTETIKGFYSFMEYFAAALAILMIVIGGFRLVIGAGNEEVQGKVKKQIMWAVVGLIVIGISEFAIKDVLFPSQGKTLPNTVVAAQFVVKLTNFISGFAATVAAIMFIYGGYLYVIAFGKEDNTAKAKKVFIGATIGLLLAMAAFGIVNTVVTLQPTTGSEKAGSSSPASLPTNPGL
ncbi:MAG: hypothetical protein WC843_02975 [Candidatus Gracilibacteria bacterium]|jgi:hypothetical protein